tara:strand:+ start:17 stop:502 length:486 start_codon:yes stop_codon:yes gene_type:complete
LNRASKKITAFLCIVSFLLYTIPSAHAAEFEDQVKKATVTELKKGEAAPFEGILLSKTAAARLYGDLNFFEKECELKLTKELDVAKLQYTAQIDVLKLKLDVENTRTEKLLQIKNERIEFLEKNWKPQPWYESGEFWLAVGLVSGILLTVGTAHAINQVDK